jgi:antitoxin PrlF
MTHRPSRHQWGFSVRLLPLIPCYRSPIIRNRDEEISTRRTHLAIEYFHIRIESKTINGSLKVKEMLSTVTQRGQVTIPAEVRRLLGTRTGDKIAFQIEDGEVRLAPASMTLESAYASVKPFSKPEDFKRIAKEAREEHVERQLRKRRHS